MAKRYIVVDDGPSLGAIVLVGLVLLAAFGKIILIVLAVLAGIAIIRSIINGTFLSGLGTFLAGCLGYYLIFGMWR